MNNISIFLVIFFILFTNVVNAEEKISEKDINILEKEINNLNLNNEVHLYFCGYKQIKFGKADILFFNQEYFGDINISYINLNTENDQQKLISNFESNSNKKIPKIKLSFEDKENNKLLYKLILKDYELIYDLNLTNKIVTIKIFDPISKYEKSNIKLQCEDKNFLKEKIKKQNKVQNLLENKFKSRSKLFDIQLLDKLENYKILKGYSYKDKTPTIVLKGFSNYEEYFNKIYKIDIKNKIYLIEPEIKNSVFQKILVATFEYKKNKIIYKIIGKSNLKENNYQYCSNFHSKITRALEEKYGWEFIPTKDYEVFSNNKRFYLAIDSYCSNDFKNLEVELMATNYYSSQKAQDIFILDLLGLKLKEEKKLDLKNF